MFHFPALFLAPDFTEEAVSAGRFRFSRRLWETSIFDLATLTTKHTLHLPYQVMDVFLGRCNSEIGVEADKLEDARDHLNALRLALYSESVSPFIVPFASNYSVNEYSGINSRDSKLLRKDLAEGLRDGLTSETGRVEAWPVELSFQCVTLWDKMNVAAEMFTRAADKADQWAKVLAACPAARAFGQAVLSAPLVVPQSQSVLHLWCALESLFPSVSAELSFRVALYLSQMTTTGPDRKRCFEKVKKGYNVRSRIAHGAKQEVTVEEWCDAWGIVTDTLDAVMRNGKVPKEDAILDGLFGIQ